MHASCLPLWPIYYVFYQMVAFQAAMDSVYLDCARRLESEVYRVSSGLALVSQVRELMGGP